MNTKAIFHCGGGSNLILGTGMENQIFILRTPAAINFFHQILKKSEVLTNICGTLICVVIHGITALKYKMHFNIADKILKGTSLVCMINIVSDQLF